MSPKMLPKIDTYFRTNTSPIKMAFLWHICVMDHETRRSQLSYRFTKRCTENPKASHMFPKNEVTKITRNPEKFKVPFAYHSRLLNSAIPSMSRQLNEYLWRNTRITKNKQKYFKIHIIIVVNSEFLLTIEDIIFFVYISLCK